MNLEIIRLIRNGLEKQAKPLEIDNAREYIIKYLNK